MLSNNYTICWKKIPKEVKVILPFRPPPYPKKCIECKSDGFYHDSRENCWYCIKCRVYQREENKKCEVTGLCLYSQAEACESETSPVYLVELTDRDKNDKDYMDEYVEVMSKNKHKSLLTIIKEFCTKYD
jgi:hypothetical protein